MKRVMVFVGVMVFVTRCRLFSCVLLKEETGHTGKSRACGASCLLPHRGKKPYV
jgi:hypothetical protein